MASKGSLENNLSKVEEYRARIAERGVSNIINGAHVAAQSGRTFETSTPIDNSVICTVAEGDAADIDAAAQAAQAAQAARARPAPRRPRTAARSPPAGCTASRSSRTRRIAGSAVSPA